MLDVERPETIENDWNVLYRDYAALYDEWGRIEKNPTAVQAIDQRFPLKGKRLVDVGSGSGLSTFELAQYADFVTGVEPEDSMRAIAVEEQRRQGIANVRFLKGTAENLPLGDRSADVVLAITMASTHYARDAAEMERVAKPGGLVLRVDISPGWYGGELEPVITGRPRDETPARGSRDDIIAGLGYDHVDFFTDQDYGTVELAVRTYGFIFGKRAIEHIKEHNLTRILWEFRIYHKRIGHRT